MKRIAYWLGVVFVLTTIPLIGIQFILFGWWPRRKPNQKRTLADTLCRSKATAIIGSFNFAIIGAILVALTTSAAFPENAGYLNPWISFFLSYSGATSFFIILFVAFVIATRSELASKTWRNLLVSSLAPSFLFPLIANVSFVLLLTLTISSMFMASTVQPSDQAKEFVNLGWGYIVSRPPNDALAMRYNKSGYELNHPEGAANIGLLYEFGFGVEKNASKAAAWYQKAIKMGSYRSAQADYQLAGLYAKGLGVDRDMSKAKTHYAEALRISTSSEHGLYIDEGQAKLARDALNQLKTE